MRDLGFDCRFADEISWQTVHYYNGQSQHTQAPTHIEFDLQCWL
jgi:hypothetical protein